MSRSITLQKYNGASHRCTRLHVRFLWLTMACAVKNTSTARSTKNAAAIEATTHGCSIANRWTNTTQMCQMPMDMFFYTADACCCGLRRGGGTEGGDGTMVIGERKLESN